MIGMPDGPWSSGLTRPQHPAASHRYGRHLRPDNAAEARNCLMADAIMRCRPGLDIHGQTRVPTRVAISETSGRLRHLVFFRIEVAPLTVFSDVDRLTVENARQQAGLAAVLLTQHYDQKMVAGLPASVTSLIGDLGLYHGKGGTSRGRPGRLSLGSRRFDQRPFRHRAGRSHHPDRCADTACGGF